MTKNHSASHTDPILEPEDDGVAFDLERFAWEAPDRLEVSGRFSGLDGKRPAPPILVVHGADGTHRLATVPGSVSGSPKDGRWWRAAFAWQEPPTAFAGT